MRKSLIFLATAALAATGVAGVTAAVATAPSNPPSRAERDYTRLLAGKTPGKPVDCIDTRFSSPGLSAYGTKLLYRVSNKLVWVSETGGGCEGVARGDALVTRQYQTQLCRGDMAQTVDMTARMPTGSCALGPFTPYRAP